MSALICSHCRKEITPDPDSCGTGYGLNADNEKICYACCGVLDAQHLQNMQPGDKTVMYITADHNLNYHKWTIINWPGTLRIAAQSWRITRHNLARYRLDVWFTYKGKNFWGYRIGDNTEIGHIQRIK